MTLSDLSRPLAFSTAEGFEVVALRDVLLFEANGNYSHIHLADGRTLLITKGLAAVERALPDEWFVRCHDRFLVGKAHVRRFQKKEGPCLVLADERKIPVAQRRRKAVAESFTIL